MSHTDPTPDFGDDTNATFESMMQGVLPDNPSFQKEFNFIDIKKQNAARESEVISFLQDSIPDMAALKKMLAHLENDGVMHPACYHVMDALGEMRRDKEYSKQPQEFFAAIARIEKFGILIEQIARTQAASFSVELSKDDILTKIVDEELFIYEERQALVDATEKFLP